MQFSERGVRPDEMYRRVEHSQVPNMENKLRLVVLGTLAVAALIVAHVYGPLLHPCGHLERTLCEDLGPTDCAAWRAEGRPGMPEHGTPPHAPRGRRGLGDAVFALVFNWDPTEPASVCRGLEQAAARETIVSELKHSLHP